MTTSLWKSRQPSLRCPCASYSNFGRFLKLSFREFPATKAHARVRADSPCLTAMLHVNPVPWCLHSSGRCPLALSLNCYHALTPISSISILAPDTNTVHITKSSTMASYVIYCHVEKSCAANRAKERISSLWELWLGACPTFPSVPPAI